MMLARNFGHLVRKPDWDRCSTLKTPTAGDKAAEWIGSARMWAAVLELAHSDASGVFGRTDADKDKPRYRREYLAAARAQTRALAWFDSPDEQPGSLRWICNSLPLLSASCERAKAHRAAGANRLEVPR